MHSRLKIGIVIQARMNSSRLPGKILMDWAGKPMLHHLIDRAKQSKLANEIIIATTDTSLDDDVEHLCKNLSVCCFRGSEKDVLSRYVEVGQKYQLDVIVRLTADNPFVGADLIDESVKYFLQYYPETEYLGNIDGCGYPHGLYVEVILAKTLEKINQGATALEAEHVTLKLRKESELFNTKRFMASQIFSIASMTVDTPEDRQFLLPIYRELLRKNKNFGLIEISQLDYS